MSALWRVAVAAALAVRAAGSLLPLDAERLHAAVGGFAVMNCHLDFPFGNEIPYHLQWDKDGETIFSWYSGDAAARVADRWGGRVRRVGPGAGPDGGPGAGGLTLGGGSINVSSVRETDAGLYRCLVSFPNRTPPSRNNGTFYYLDVEGGDLIAVAPRNLTVREGERAELECAPRSADWEVRWFREDREVGAAGAAEGPAVAGNGSLVWGAARAEAGGRYECRVRAADGRRQAAGAALDVQYAARVQRAGAERALRAGAPASLDCHFSANPPLTNLRWEKDGFLFDPYNVPGVFYSRNGSLLFNKVEEAHEGVYSCTAYNALGTAGPGGGVRVRVLRPPALALRPRPLYLARLGHDVTLPCAAEHDPRAPPPALQWTRRDGAPLPAARHALDGGNLTISAVREEDRGVYVCAAANEAGEVRAESELLLENAVPRAAHGLRARAGARWVHVRWAAGAGAAGLEHAVWYRERGAAEWRTLRVLTRGRTEATLAGLRPSATYEVRVLSQDPLGDGLFSKPLFVTTADLESIENDEVSVTEDTRQPEEPAPVEPAADLEQRVATGAPPVPPPTPPPGAGAGSEALADGVGELPVRVLAVEGGALVVWTRAAADVGECSVRWYGEEPPRLLADERTPHDHLLVRALEEGAAYRARVQCGRAWGAAGWRAPDAGRLRAAAAAVAGAALALGALGTAYALYRRRRRPRRGHDKRSR